MPRLDPITRAFWRLKGRPVNLTGAEQWLSAPMHGGQTVGDGWLEAAADAHGGSVQERVAGGGLLADMAQLDGPDFTAADLRPEVRDFYEHTSNWRMEVWTQWNPIFQPGGELISRYFGRRVQQLALPTRPLEVAYGMDSRVALIVGPNGDQLAAGWIRTLRSTGEFVYSGCYSSRLLPGAHQPSVHVAFPLEARSWKRPGLPASQGATGWRTRVDLPGWRFRPGRSLRRRTGPRHTRSTSTDP
jgi:hypothetical protein